MYQPGHGKFNVDDPLALLAELAQQRVATLVSIGDGGFWTTMLPLIVGEGVLRGHVARANNHWRALERDARAVALFYGPDAYISPAWYEEKRLTGKVVPTWNYSLVAVHGSIRVHHEPEWLLENVRELVLRHEAPRPAPWHIDDAPADYIQTQARAIVGLELAIERIEAKQKLTQNRSVAARPSQLIGATQSSAGERGVGRTMM
jgi:transcriptional regulator